MPGEKHSIRFDDHGHILVEEPELARRILHLLRHDGELVVRMRLDEPVSPVNRICPVPGNAGPIVRNTICPNVMCECGALKIVDEVVFEKQWSELGGRRGGRGGTS